jgi:hypothetical protein
LDCRGLSLRLSSDLPDKAGCGIELNPDGVKAHLAAGEKYWT